MDLIVHAVCFNEEALLPHFLAYYGPQAKKIRIYDNRSTDRSVEIALAHPNVEVFDFDTGGKLSELTLMEIRNHAWKQEKCDCVVVCDIDEFLYPHDIVGFVQRHPDVDVFQPQGYDMVCDEFPVFDGRLITERVQWGAPAENYSKMACFRPARVVDMNFGPGSHRAEPVGRGELKFHRAGTGADDLKLLHYKNLGLPYRLKRHQALKGRLGGPEFERFRFGYHYGFDAQVQEAEFSALKSRAIQVL